MIDLDELSAKERQIVNRHRVEHFRDAMIIGLLVSINDRLGGKPGTDSAAVYNEACKSEEIMVQTALAGLCDEP